MTPTPPVDLSEVPTYEMIRMLHRGLKAFRAADLSAWRRTVGRLHPGASSEPYHWQINAILIRGYIDTRLVGLSREPIPEAVHPR
jgi:hypothetical protein